jgi:pimeloyl-ACP methyl ester carboxylesterase
MSHKIHREPYGIVYTEQAAFKDTYGGLQGMVFLEAHRLVPRDMPSDTVLIFMHPIGGGAYLPVVTQLARQGNHVIYCNSRYRGIDSGLLMEKVVLDLGAAISDAKTRFGYSKVVLAGWSGGGALSLFYQRQAVSPTITHTPAGDPLDLTTANLQPADALLLLAAHPSRHRVLVDSIDPAIVDESDPDTRDPALDIYGDAVAPPFSDDFLTRYRAAQLDRNRRISAWVRRELERLRSDGRGDEERGFVVHGTMADPRALDAAIDPNERTPGESFLGDPRIANMGPVGLARFSTLRSWLSQWSADDSQADGLAAAPHIDVPALLIEHGADNVCTPSYAQAMYDALGSADKTKHRIAGANHYLIGADQIDKVRESARICTEWLEDRGFPSIINATATS